MLRMLKVYLIAFIFPMIILGHDDLAQDDVSLFIRYKPDTRNTACKQEMRRAESDFLSPAYTIRLERSIPFSNTQQKVLLTDYGAKADFTNPFFEDCYNYHLIMLLNRKFGMDVVQLSLSKADSMDEAGLGTNMNV